MDDNSSLYYKALLAWRRELVKQHKANLRFKQLSLRDAMRQKLIELFGTRHLIEVESQGNENASVIGATVENLHFLGISRSAGDIHIVLMVPCPSCGRQILSSPLSCLADLGRELLQVEMSGTLSDHECSGTEKDMQE